MNREEFVRGYAAQYGMTIRSAREACYNVFEYLADRIAVEDRVYIIGLGTFKKQKRKARRIRNVNTGECDVIPETEKIVFVASDKVGRDGLDDDGYDEN